MSTLASRWGVLAAQPGNANAASSSTHWLETQILFSVAVLSVHLLSCLIVSLKRTHENCFGMGCGGAIWSKTSTCTHSATQLAPGHWRKHDKKSTTMLCMEVSNEFLPLYHLKLQNMFLVFTPRSLRLAPCDSTILVWTPVPQVSLPPPDPSLALPSSINLSKYRHRHDKWL